MVPLENTYLVITSFGIFSYPWGEVYGSLLLNISETVAFVTPAYPYLYIKSVSYPTLILEREEIPSTKHIASNIFDLPLPFKPVIAVKDLSNG